jgi:hypothetical protein
MKTNGLLILKVFLVLIAAFHVIVGVGVNVSGEFPKTMAAYYGAQKVNWTPELIYMLHPLGAFMFVLGCLAVVAAMDPLKHRAIVYAFTAEFIIRGLQRIAFREDTVKLFEISPTRNMLTMVFFVGMGVVLYALHSYVSRQASGAAPSP